MNMYDIYVLFFMYMIIYIYEYSERFVFCFYCINCRLFCEFFEILYMVYMFI